MTLNMGSPPNAMEVAVNFSQDPAASFGSTLGQSVPGTIDSGSVWVKRASSPQAYLPVLLKSR